MGAYAGVETHYGQARMHLAYFLLRHRRDGTAGTPGTSPPPQGRTTQSDLLCWQDGAAAGRAQIDPDERTVHDHATFGSGPTHDFRCTGLKANLWQSSEAEALAGIHSHVSRELETYVDC